MKTIKYFIAVTALATILGPVIVYAGPGQSRLAGDLLEMQREGREKAAQLQKEEREKAARLQAAACSGSLNDAIKALGAGANINAVNYRGETSLLLATQNHHPEIVAMLLKAKAEVNKANCGGQAPLLLASHQGHTGIVAMLLGAKAEVDKASNYGETPLFVASQNGHTEVVVMLLGAKAEVDKASKTGATPLLLASHQGHTEIATMLLGAKAEVDKANQRGATPLLLASQEGHAETAKILVFNGAISSGRESIAMKAIIDQVQEARRTVANQDWLLEDVPLSEFLPKVLEDLVGGYIDPLAGVHDEQLRRLMREQVVKNRTDRQAQESAAAAQLLEKARRK